MNKLGAAILMISKGTPFWQAGEEMLRTKNGDENSYKSSDEINNIDWSVLRDDSMEYQTMLYYKGLIEMRHSYNLFTDVNTEITCNVLQNGIMTVEISNGEGDKALILINPNPVSLPYTIDGEWHMIADGNQAGSSIINTESGEVMLDSVAMRVYVNNAK